jgi:putative ABC transport system permease protein
MPDFKVEIRARLADLDLPPVRETEIFEELSQHIEEEYERALSCGASEEEARQQALEQLNAPDLLRRELKRVEHRASENPITFGAETKTNFFADVGQDLRYGLRMLVKSPVFTSVAVLALALGIGANSAIFSVVNAVLLRPLPFKNPDELVMVWDNAAQQGFPKDTPSPANFLDWRQQNNVFTGMSATVPRSFNLTGVGEPERLDGRRVSANLFDLLGVRPLLGRTFAPDEDKPGTKVVLMSEGLWRRRFGSDPEIIGRAVTLSGESYSVIGVLPKEVELPARDNWHDQLWVPIAFPSEEAASRGSHYLDVIARLKPGISVKQAQAEMDTIATALAQQYPQFNQGRGAVVTPLHEQVVGDIRPALLVLLGAVAFVLLIACANVANLLLARAAVREKEIALRLALGASRSRITRQFLTESVLLSAIGGGTGLLFSLAALTVLRRFIPPDISRIQAIAIDAKVLMFTLAVSLLTAFIFGIAPALHAVHSNLNETLKDSGRDSAAGARGNRLRNVLVISEVAVSFLLLIGAGLLINSFMHLRNLNPGFKTDHILTMKVELSEVKYPDKEHRAAFFDELRRRVQNLPGVETVAIGNNLPFTYNGDSVLIAVEGIPDPQPNQWPDVVVRVISPKYFQTMGIPLVMGRDFTQHDNASGRKVVIVTEKTARHYWPGQNPIGKRLKPGTTASKQPWWEVIGVVKDVRQNDFVAEPKMQMYMPHAQVQSFAANALVVRSKVEPLSLAASVRNQVWEIDPDQPVSEIRTMQEIVAGAVARQRFSMVLLGVFAGLALVLAAVGIYGVMSYSVAQRTREIGIRMALGAQRTDVLKITVTQGLKLVGFGLLIGLAVALVLTRVMASLLFRISATDPITFVAISLVLLAVAILASYVPALRATKVDPIIALHAQ